MPALGFLVTYVGYWAFAYGLATVRGCNVSFVGIGWPGSAKWTGCNPDPSSGGSIPGSQVSKNLTTAQSQGTSGVSAAQAAADQRFLKNHPGITLQK